MAKTPVFHRGHYNIIAAQFRREFEKYNEHSTFNTYNRYGLSELALSMTRRLVEDSEAFDPHRFLEACSPTNYAYPLVEEWDEN